MAGGQKYQRPSGYNESHVVGDELNFVAFVKKEKKRKKIKNCLVDQKKSCRENNEESIKIALNLLED